jgi:hypothetical protein
MDKFCVSAELETDWKESVPACSKLLASCVPREKKGHKICWYIYKPFSGAKVEAEISQVGSRQANRWTAAFGSPYRTDMSTSATDILTL